jgi:hypothetical protein
MMKPENIKLSEELDFSGPVSFLLNRAGKRVVGCSTQAVWNLVTLLNEWPKGSDPMDGLMTIRAGIKEDFTSQGASHEATVAYLKSEPIFMENVDDTFKTEEKSAKEIIKLLNDHLILLFSYGVESMPNQGHLGVMHVTNKKLYLDGTELDLETATKFLYSSKLNHVVVFSK